MTSLRALAPAAGTTTTALLAAFEAALEPLVVALRAGSFPSQAWRNRQLTNGSVVRLERPDGSAETVRAVDVDAASGALVVESLLGERPARAITVGEIRHLRLSEV
jgi:biotin-(acetyl-CoA carboxylase) ligase